MAWSYEFDENAGYDGMTAGFTVKNHDGYEILVVDVVNFDHVEPRPNPHFEGGWHHPDFQRFKQKRDELEEEWKHRRSPAAEALARLICQRCGE